MTCSCPRATPIPAGRFDSALPLLTRLTEMGRPFARVGITGYPESHPRIDDDITVQAMWDKRHHSSYIVSNLCFDPAVLRKWVARIRARGVTLPLYVGLAGPVDRARLLRMAARAGVAESTRFLAGHTDLFLRLGLPGGYSPERLLDRTGAALTAQAPPWPACTCSLLTRSGRRKNGGPRCCSDWAARTAGGWPSDRTGSGPLWSRTAGRDAFSIAYGTLLIPG